MDSYLELLKTSQKPMKRYDGLSEKKTNKLFKRDVEGYLNKKVKKFDTPFDYLVEVAKTSRRRALIFEGVLPPLKQNVLYYKFVGIIQRYFKIDNMNMFQLRIKSINDSDLHQIYLYWNERQTPLGSFADIIKSTIEGIEDTIIEMGV